MDEGLSEICKTRLSKEAFAANLLITERKGAADLMRPHSAAMEMVVKKGIRRPGKVFVLCPKRWRRVREEDSGPSCTAFTLPAHVMPTAPRQYLQALPICARGDSLLRVAIGCN